MKLDEPYEKAIRANIQRVLDSPSVNSPGALRATIELAKCVPDLLDEIERLRDRALAAECDLRDIS